MALSEALISENKEKRTGKAEESSRNHLQTCRRQEEMSPGWNGRRSQRRYNGEGCPHSFWDKFLHLSTHRRKVKREQAVSLTLSDPQDTGRLGLSARLEGSRRELEGTGWQRVAQMRRQRKKSPVKCRKAPSTLASPAWPMNRGGDRSLISDAKSQELRAAGRY